MVHPAELKPGDKIAIISPAGKVDREIVANAAKLLESERFVVEVGSHAFDAFHLFAGNDTLRAQDMQRALDDPEVRAILFSRGGYGSLRTLMLLDWTKFYLYPKWLIGFSDITVFHAFLSGRNISSIHGAMPAFFFENGKRSESFDRLLALLRGNSVSYQLQSNALNLPGICHGQLVGGNLSLLLSLRGTKFDQSFEGKVLFIEDIGEYDYHIDRMMMNLKAGNVLAGLAGLIVGYFTETKTSSAPFGLNANEIIREVVADCGIPVVFGFPAGHELPNYPLVMGSEIFVEVTGETVSIRQPF